MDYKSEIAIDCVEYVRNEDGSGGTAIIEVPTSPLGLRLRISGVLLLRISYRRLLEIQARLLARVLEGEIGEYPVFTTR